MSDAAIVKAAPAKEESWVTSWVRRAKGEIEKAAPVGVKPYAREVGSLVGEYAEGAVTGALLGAAQATFGLDHGVPVDGVVAGVAGLVALASAGTHPGVASAARTVAGQSFAVMTYRKTESFISRGRGPGGGGGGGQLRAIRKPPPANASMAGEIDNDPVVRAFNKTATAGIKG